MLISFCMHNAVAENHNLWPCALMAAMNLSKVSKPHPYNHANRHNARVTSHPADQANELHLAKLVLEIGLHQKTFQC